jgi:hypothetical protein
MKTNNPVRMIGAVVVAVLLAVSQANGTIAYQYASGAYGNQGTAGGKDNFVFGLEFTVGSTPLSVTDLGAFDNGQNGWAAPVSVAIYDSATTLQVGSTVTFSGASGANLGTLGSDGGSRFLPVTPFTLNAGQTYMVVAAGYGSLTSGSEVDYSAVGLLSNDYATVSPWIAAGANYRVAGTALVFPTGVLGNVPKPAFNAGTFEFTPVPEVATFGAAATGLLGLVYVARHVRIRRKIPGA